MIYAMILFYFASLIIYADDDDVEEVPLGIENSTEINQNEENNETTVATETIFPLIILQQLTQT
jgi:hypothetical protein